MISVHEYLQKKREYDDLGDKENSAQPADSAQDEVEQDEQGMEYDGNAHHEHYRVFPSRESSHDMQDDSSGDEDHSDSDGETEVKSYADTPPDGSVENEQTNEDGIAMGDKVMDSIS